jgi:hypothetical protein
VVEHRVAEQEVERVVLEGQLGGVAGRGLDLEAEPPGVGLERLDHPGRDVRARRRADHARAQQVEREVARARADLERARERARVRAQELRELAEHLRSADLAEVDPPFRVVVVRRHVVVAAVDVEDLVRGRGRRSR